MKKVFLLYEQYSIFEAISQHITQPFANKKGRFWKEDEKRTCLIDALHKEFFDGEYAEY